MASESLQCKTLVLRVSIHCEGCKKKVKRVLQRVDGVYRCDIDGRSNKVTVAATGSVSADALVRKLRRSGKKAEEWPEERKPKQPAGAQSSEETKNQATEPADKPVVAATEKPLSGDADESAEVEKPVSSGNAAVEPKKVASGTARPAQECAQRQSSPAGDDGGANGDAIRAGAEQESNAPKRKRKQQQQQPADAVAVTVATAVPDHHAASLALSPPPPPPRQQPAVLVTSYSMARPSVSAAYCSAAAAPPPPRSPQQGHVWMSSI